MYQDFLYTLKSVYQALFSLGHVYQKNVSKCILEGAFNLPYMYSFFEVARYLHIQKVSKFFFWTSIFHQKILDHNLI